MKILIVEVNWLGDVLFSTPAIKAIRKKFPESSISCLVVPRVREILEGNPNLDEIIINSEDSWHKGFLGKIRLARELKSKKFDLAVLFHRSATRAFIVWLAGIPRRIGYGRPRLRPLLTDALPAPKKDSLHRVDHYLGIVKYLGCDIQDRFYEFFTREEDLAFVGNFLEKEGLRASGDFIICLNPAGNWEQKRWPKENFSRLADQLIHSYQAKVIFTGSSSDLGLIEEIKKGMLYQPTVSAGKLSLKQTACLFKKASLVISGDSGPLHIAASQGLDLIALFGPTSAAITGPIGKGKIKIMQKVTGSDCQIPCYDAECKKNMCMSDISVEDVMNEVKSFLPKGIL